MLPPTIRQVTGSRGQHILFRPVGDSPPGSLGKGIDVKWRGHIVTAPSVHPDTGRRYAWLPDLHPLRTPIAEMPPWLAELLSPPPPPPVGHPRPVIEEESVGWGPCPAYSRAALLSAYENIASAPIGQQDVTLICEAFSIGTLVAAGAMPRSLAIDMLVDAGLQMVNAPGRRPWTRREIQEKVARSLSAGERHPRRSRHDNPRLRGAPAGRR